MTNEAAMFSIAVYAIDREVFVGKAHSVLLPFATGSSRIVPDQEPLISFLQKGNIVIQAAEDDRKISISGGLAQITPGEAIILVTL